MLNKEAQDLLAASINKAARRLQNLTDALDRSVSFYLPKHKEKWSKFNQLKNLLQFSATGKDTSVPDCLGIVLNALEFDAAEAREAKLRYHRISKTVHPDHGGSDELFKIASLAYKARDLRLLDILSKAVSENITFEQALSLLDVRIYAAISQLQAKPAFKLLKLDPASGKNGIINSAYDYAEAMLDQLISALQIIILQGDKNAQECK